MRMILVTAALASSVFVTTAPANAVEDHQRCVTPGEFTRLPGGLTRRKVETRWEVVGQAKWDANRSNPGHDAYTYPACGDRRADTTVRVIYARHTRVWTLRVWNRHYA